MIFVFLFSPQSAFKIWTLDLGVQRSTVAERSSPGGAVLENVKLVFCFDLSAT